MKKTRKLLVMFWLLEMFRSPGRDWGGEKLVPLMAGCAVAELEKFDWLTLQ